MNIYLIGFRCTGKTTVSEILAKQLGWDAIDSDVELVKEQGTTIADIVAEKGWDAFRSMEKSIIIKLGVLNHHVVATGGGAILDEENVAGMKENGKVVWLTADPETIGKRMAQDETTEDSRPALTDKGIYDEIKETLLIRNPKYEKAMDFSVSTVDYDIKEVCRIIMDKFNIDTNKKV